MIVLSRNVSHLYVEINKCVDSKKTDGPNFEKCMELLSYFRHPVHLFSIRNGNVKINEQCKETRYGREKKLIESWQTNLCLFTIDLFIQRAHL